MCLHLRPDKTTGRTAKRRAEAHQDVLLGSVVRRVIGLSTARLGHPNQPAPGGNVQPMTTTSIDRLAAQAMTLATDTMDEDEAMARLRELAHGDERALEEAIRTCLAN